MENTFYRPSIGKQIRCQSHERKMVVLNQFNETNSERHYDDILEVLKWFDDEIKDCHQTIQMAEQRIKSVEQRKKKILSIPSVQETLKSNLTLEDLSFSLRTRDELSRIGILTISELCKFSEKDILSYRKVGKKAIQEIKEKLSKYGLRMRDDDTNIDKDYTQEESVQKYLEKKFDELFGALNEDDDET